LVLNDKGMTAPPPYNVQKQRGTRANCRPGQIDTSEREYIKLKSE